MNHESKLPGYESAAVKAEVESWVNGIANQFKAKKIHWCDGSEQEANAMSALLVKNGTFTPLNQKLRPNCFLARTDPADTFRPDNAAFICCKAKEDAGTTKLPSPCRRWLKL